MKREPCLWEVKVEAEQVARRSRLAFRHHCDRIGLGLVGRLLRCDMPSCRHAASLPETVAPLKPSVEVLTSSYLSSAQMPVSPALLQGRKAMYARVLQLEGCSPALLNEH